MEEKERFELFGEHCIKDNNPNVPCQLLDTYKACVILNEQDKENQQLKQSQKQLAIEELKKLKENAWQSATDISQLIDYTELAKIIDNQIKKLKGREVV